MQMPRPASRAITKLLIANRGEIAARIIRSAHALGITTVAVYSDPDAEAPYVTQADQAVRLPGAAPADTYLRGDLIIAAAAATGADAVHPGYGFLSENAAFARACDDAGLIFVGPAPETIEAMGDKIAAKTTMAEAGVPTLPSMTVTDHTDHTDLAAAAAGVGFPLLVKAAFGGGGRGMRLVADPAELAQAVSSARREAASAFGDGTVFLERFVTDPRHVEVQILGDTTGTVIHLFERECSIQRRYQKIVEECPSPGVGEGLRGRRAGLRRPRGRHHRRHGLQDGRQGDHGRGRGAGAPGADRHRSRGRRRPARSGLGGWIPAAGQGSVRRRRAGHAAGRRPGRTGRGGQQRAPRGRLRVR